MADGQRAALFSFGPAPADRCARDRPSPRRREALDRRRDFVVTDEMKVTVAGQAALLALGRTSPITSTACSRSSSTPAATCIRRVDRGSHRRRGLVSRADRALLAGRAGGRPRRQPGTQRRPSRVRPSTWTAWTARWTEPAAGRSRQLQTWYRVTEAEYLRLVGQARRNEVCLLDHYGASEPGRVFRRGHGVLLRAAARHAGATRRTLRRAAGFLPAGPGRVAARRHGRCPSQSAGRNDRRSRPRGENSGVAAESPPLADSDALFTLAVEYLSEEHYGLAARTPSRVIEAGPRRRRGLSTARPGAGEARPLPARRSKIATARSGCDPEDPAPIAPAGRPTWAWDSTSRRWKTSTSARGGQRRRRGLLSARPGLGGPGRLSPRGGRFQPSRWRIARWRRKSTTTAAWPTATWATHEDAKADLAKAFHSTARGSSGSSELPAQPGGGGHGDSGASRQIVAACRGSGTLSAPLRRPHSDPLPRRERGPQIASLMERYWDERRGSRKGRLPG